MACIEEFYRFLTGGLRKYHENLCIITVPRFSSRGLPVCEVNVSEVHAASIFTLKMGITAVKA
jgi:hypothetical protein